MTISLNNFSQYLNNKANKQRIPLSGQFELTPRCNLSCKMCYITKRAADKATLLKELTADEWISVAKAAKAAGMLYLLLTGGEVFIRKDFRQIYEELSKMGFFITIYTNATLINEEIARWLGENPPFKMEVTIYGATTETYKKVTGASDAFRKMLTGIELLQKENIPLEFRTTVIQDNYLEFEEIASFAEERGIKLGIVNYIFPPQKNQDTCSCRLNPEMQAEYDIKVEDFFKKKNAEKKKHIKSEIFSTVEALQEDNKTLPFQDEGYKTLPFQGEGAFYCSAGKSAFWINWKGEMTACQLITDTSIFPLTDGFKNSWNKLIEFCSSVPSCKECLDCALREQCLSCPARLKMETGHFDRAADYLCKLTEIKASKRQTLENIS